MSASTKRPRQRPSASFLQFLAKEGPADKVQQLIDKLPGAAEAMQSAPEDSSSGGMFGGGVMAAGTRMMAAGLSMGQVQAVTRETIKLRKRKARGGRSRRDRRRDPRTRPVRLTLGGGRRTVGGVEEKSMSYPITHIEGLDVDEIKSLKAIGIRTTERLLEDAKSPKGPRAPRRQDRASARSGS